MTRDNSNQKILTTLIAVMALIVLTMVISIFVVTRRPIVVILPGEGAPQSVAASPTSGTGDLAVISEAGAGENAPPAEVNVSSVHTAPPSDNPLDPFWEKISGSEIALQTQQVAEPVLSTITVPSLKVQAVHDASRYLWRLSWSQATPSTQSDFGEFSDAVSIQFPLADGAPYTMGGPNMPVVMLYWKAIWQKDADERFQDVIVTKPNSYSDFYWFASQTGPMPADELAADATAKQWMIAAAAGNPMADFKRKCPMEELTAHGFGTSTHVENSAGLAKGKWDNGQWFVVFERPIQDADPLIARFKQNPQQQLIAFAVWDGAAQNRGGKKHISNWVPMRISQ